MTTLTKTRTDNSRRAKNARRRTETTKPRYVTKTAANAAFDREEKTENAWVLFALAMVLLAGLGFIVGITYVLLLG